MLFLFETYIYRNLTNDKGNEMSSNVPNPTSKPF